MQFVHKKVEMDKMFWNSVFRKYFNNKWQAINIFVVELNWQKEKKEEKSCGKGHQ